MIVENKISLLETHGIDNIKNIDIGNVPLFIELILTQLYKDPIAAFVREVASNARDANREAGKGDKPIVIYLPTEFDPSLKISDNGLGISDIRINDIFSKLGNSTKKETNDFTGGFGLGSKTPWTYTDIFNISTSYRKDNKIIKDAWVAPKQDGGKLLLLSREEDSDPDAETGTTIEIPINKKDFAKVKDEVISLMDFWEVPAKIFPERNNSKKTEFIIKSNDWGIYNSEKRSGFKAIIDGISYAIDHSFTYDRKDIGLQLLNNNLLHANIALLFNNGDLNLAISRDSLFFDQKTINKISDKLKIFIKEYITILSDNIKNASSYEEALKVLVESRSAVSCLNVNLTDYYWNNIKLKEFLTNEDFGKEYAKIVSFYPKVSSYRKKKSGESSYFRQGDTIYFNSRTDKNLCFFSKKKEINTEIIKYLLEKENYNHVTVLHLPEFDENGNVIQYDLSYFNILALECLDDIEVVPPSKKITKKKISSSEDKSLIVGRRLNYTFFDEKPQLIENDQDGFYVEVDSLHKRIILGNHILYDYNLPYNIRMLIPENVPIYGFTKRVIPHLSKKWYSLHEYIKHAARDYVNSYDYDIFKIFEFYNYRNSNDAYKLQILQDVLKKLFSSKEEKEIFEKSDFQHLSEMIDNFENYENSVTKNIYEMFTHNYFELEKPVFAPSSLEGKYFSLKEKYPLFFVLLYENAIMGNKKEILDYIKVFSERKV